MRDSGLKNSIIVVPFGTLEIEQFWDSLEAAALLHRLQPIISRDDIVLESEITAEERRRKQREASNLIKSARHNLKELDAKWRFALIVTNFDLFVKGMNFVFGLANAQENVGILSTARLTLWEDGLTPSKIKERIFKEAAHELGHLGMLGHCKNPSCLMSFAENADKVDEKLPLLCDDCKRHLRTSGR
jgi:archaemetzincin